MGLSEAPGTKAPPALKLFLSYSHKDEEIKNELRKHIFPLARSGLILEWHDGKIEPGDKWDTTILKNLEGADIIVFLISIDFINSKYCYDTEMEVALDREADGLATIIPILVRNCLWKTTKLAPFQALPKDEQAIASWPDRDAALTEVADGIRIVAERLQSER